MSTGGYVSTDLCASPTGSEQSRKTERFYVEQNCVCWRRLLVECAPLAAEPGISSVILTSMKILQRSVRNEKECVCSAPNSCDTEQRSASQPASQPGSEWDTLFCGFTWRSIGDGVNLHLNVCCALVSNKETVTRKILTLVTQSHSSQLTLL